MKTTSASADFDQRYQTHLKHLKLKGLQPKTMVIVRLRIFPSIAASPRPEPEVNPGT